MNNSGNLNNQLSVNLYYLYYVLDEDLLKISNAKFGLQQLAFNGLTEEKLKLADL